MKILVQAARRAWVELRANPRLRYGLVLIAAVTLMDLGLRWSDAVARQQQVLAKLQSELAVLQTGANNEMALTESLAMSKRIGEALDSRLWAVSSEAVGQARLKDWLAQVLKRSMADQQAITLGASKEFGKFEGVVAGAPVEAQSKSDDSLREFRATISFNLTPRALEGVLLEVEGGEPFAAVETLTAKGQERRVEMTLRVLMRIKAGNHV